MEIRTCRYRIVNLQLEGNLEIKPIILEIRKVETDNVARVRKKKTITQRSEEEALA